MATTSTVLAKSALAALHASGVKFALLHGPHDWETSVITSDVDIVIDRPVSAIGSAWNPALKTVGLQPIVVWNYDIDATSVFVVDADCSGGAQIDMNYGGRGTGRYGILSAPLLDRRISEPFPARLHPTDEWLYLLQKRLVKGQRDRVQELLSVPPDNATAITERASEIFSRSAFEGVMCLLRGGQDPVPHRHIGALVPRTRWAIDRLLRPAGYWVHFTGAAESTEPMIQAVQERFGRILPHIQRLGGPGRSTNTTIWATRKGVITRLRPGLVVSSGMPVRLFPADLKLSANGDPSEVLPRLVRAMAVRYGFA